MFPLPAQGFSPSLILIACMSFLLAAISIPARPNSQPIVPLTRGTYWVYKKVSQECDVQTLTVQKQTVVDSFTRGKISCALIESRDLFKRSFTVANSEEDEQNKGTKPVPLAEVKDNSATQPTFTIRLVADNCRYYEICIDMHSEFNSINDYWQTLKNQTNEIAEPSESELMMKLPAKVGSFWDGDDRPDGWYSWRVESIERQSLPFDSPKESLAYEVSFRSCPDDSHRTFVPGIGITNTEYHHHGTIMEDDCRLIDFGIGS